MRGSPAGQLFAIQCLVVLVVLVGAGIAAWSNAAAANTDAAADEHPTPSEIGRHFRGTTAPAVVALIELDRAEEALRFAAHELALAQHLTDVVVGGVGDPELATPSWRRCCSARPPRRGSGGWRWRSSSPTAAWACPARRRRGRSSGGGRPSPRRTGRWAGASGSRWSPRPCTAWAAP